MAATVVYNSARFGEDGKHPWISAPADGLAGDVLTYQIVADQMGEAGDFSAILAVPEGKRLLYMFHTNADLDSDGSPALDADIVLRTYDSTGTPTDTVLLNNGTGFQAAVTTPVVTLLGSPTTHKVPASALGYGLIGFKVVTAAATAAAGNITLGLFWR